MTARLKWGFLSAGLCIATLLMATLPGTQAAEQSYSNIFSSNAPQNAQERAGLLKEIKNVDETNALHDTLTGSDLYEALRNPYAVKDPQAGLERANTYKSLQKYNSIYSSSRSEDNWYYWTGIWLNGLQDASGANIYSTMNNPLAYRDPQASLELANTYKSLQKYNSIYSSSRSEENWYYWTDIWLNQ